MEEPRDDFAWTQSESGSKLYIFGGFVQGLKGNDVLCYDLEAE